MLINISLPKTLGRLFNFTFHRISNSMKYDKIRIGIYQTSNVEMDEKYPVNNVLFLL